MLWSLIAVLSLSASLAATDRLVFRSAPAGGGWVALSRPVSHQQRHKLPAAASPHFHLCSLIPQLSDEMERIFSVCARLILPLQTIRLGGVVLGSEPAFLSASAAAAADWTS